MHCLVWLQANQLHREVERKDQKLERLERENVSLTAQNKDYKEENKSLEKGLREVHDLLKQEGETSDVIISFIFHHSLDSILAYKCWQNSRRIEYQILVTCTMSSCFCDGIN